MAATPELPKHYDARATETKWQRYWEEKRTYAWDPNRPEPVFAVDTPPPTVSGVIHIGHVFSYTQAEIVVRYKRLRGFNVFYPFGFDDNGLPTERFVEKARGVKASDLPREEFIKLCLEVCEEAEKAYEELWRSLGLSADWSLTYRTIAERSRRISQRSFLDLLAKGLASRRDAPNLWCPQCETGLAQADAEDVEMEGQFHEIAFRSDDGRDLVIATTRPELIPACVAMIHHPEDARYRDLAGHRARVPISGHEVPILADPKVDREKGTGLVMCSTFGDQTDVEWWRQFSLPYRQTITSNGRLMASGAELDGLTIPQGRAKIVELLRAAGVLRSSRPIVHAVKVHERCKTPIEILCRKQWYVHLLDHKPELLKAADEIRWHPDFMKSRYLDWVENLALDWCVSRQRRFGVPIPVWYCGSCGAVIPAAEKDLPVDPLAQRPSAPCAKCGGRDFEAEADVFDTWATSSMSPQINARWREPDDRSAKIFPMHMRPQAHDIIRTWAFYTILKSLYHDRRMPWTDIVISGHVKIRTEAPRKQQGKGAAKSKLEKISKSRLQGGEVSTPSDLIEEWSADAVRYWTAGSSLGADQAYDLKEMDQGKRLLTKLYNASKFALMHLADYQGSATCRAGRSIAGRSPASGAC
jgi:valyl-tRNA synthetase